MEDYRVDTVSEQLVQLENLTQQLMKQFEQISAEWNDVELAITDVNHFREFFEFDEKGLLLLDEKRAKLFNERRRYKQTYLSLLPYVEHLGALRTKFEELHLRQKEQLQTKPIYGIRSMRGFNLFYELQEHFSAEDEQLFADITDSQIRLKHIYQPHLQNLELFKVVKPKVEKVTAEKRAVAKNVTLTELHQMEQSVLQPPKSELPYRTLEDKEREAQWATSFGRTETEEQRKARIEQELHESVHRRPKY